MSARREKCLRKMEQTIRKFEAVYDPSNLCRVYKMSKRGKRWKKYSNR